MIWPVTKRPGLGSSSLAFLNGYPLFAALSSSGCRSDSSLVWTAAGDIDGPYETFVLELIVCWISKVHLGCLCCELHVCTVQHMIRSGQNVNLRLLSQTWLGYPIAGIVMGSHIFFFWYFRQETLHNKSAAQQILSHPYLFTIYRR